MTKSAKQRQILTGGRWAETTAGTRKGAGGRASQDEGPRQSGGGGSGRWGRVEEGGWPGEACGTAVPRGRGGQADQGAAGSNQETPRALSAAWSSSRIARSGGSESLCRLAPLCHVVRGLGPRSSVPVRARCRLPSYGAALKATTLWKKEPTLDREPLGERESERFSDTSKHGSERH